MKFDCLCTFLVARNETQSQTQIVVFCINCIDLQLLLMNLLLLLKFVYSDPLSISTWFLKYRVSLDFFSISNSKKKSISKLDFFVELELDFYCLCGLQKSISKSNWFFNFLNLIFRNWKKIEWHSIFQKSSGDRQGVCCPILEKGCNRPKVI